MHEYLKVSKFDERVFIARQEFCPSVRPSVRLSVRPWRSGIR